MGATPHGALPVHDPGPDHRSTDDVRRRDHVGGGPSRPGLSGPADLKPVSSVAVVLGLERALDRDTDVVGLVLAQGGEAHPERVEVEAGHLLVEHLGQGVHADRVLLGLGEQFDLGALLAAPAALAGGLLAAVGMALVGPVALLVGGVAFAVVFSAALAPIVVLGGRRLDTYEPPAT